MELWRYGRAVEQLGQRYRLQKPLGSGGMADVCLAWDEREQRQVAIKVIKQDVLDQGHLDRFVKEAAQVAQWRHPHILRFYSDLKLELLDASKGSIIPYIVMEYAQGGDLHKRLTPGQPYPLNHLLTVFPQLCSAVSYAHKRGVIHRDLKPLNILFRVLPGGEEQVVLSDFGLAVEVSASHQTFARGGTLPYMAPEQFQGYVMPASDIFALGVILYLLTTGHLPFRRSLRSMIELRGEPPQGSREQAVPTIMRAPVPPSQLQSTLPAAFDEVIARALATDPARRYQDALHLWEEARAALYAPGMTASTAQRSDTHRTRATRLSTASMPAMPEDIAPGVSPAISPPRVPIDTGYEEHNSYISTDSDMPAATSLVRRRPSTPSRNGGQGEQEIQRQGQAGQGQVVQERGQGEAGQDQVVQERGQGRVGRGQGQATAPTILYPTRYSRGSGLSLPSSPPLPSSPMSLPSSHPYRTILVIVAVLLLLGVSLAYLPAVRNTLPPVVPLLSNAVDVTITPASRTLNQSYPLTAVIGNADPAQMQVQARMATSPAQIQQKTANATGMRKTAGAQAKGQLLFLNGAFVSQTVPVGTMFTGNDGVQVVSDENAVIPAADTNTNTAGRISVAAHSVSTGIKGNIAAQNINVACCVANKSVFVRNDMPFAGGQDPKSYAFVQQSDEDAVANPLKGPLSQQGVMALRGQLAPNEQPATALSAGACTPNVTSDQPIGDTGANVTSANVTVSVTCSIEVYDSAAAKAIAARQLTARAASMLGNGYAPRDSRALREDITIQGIDQQRTVALSVQARGTWLYHFSASQRQSIAHQLVGKSRAAALQLLQQTPGISAVAIPTRVTALPNDTTRINLIVTGDPGV